MGGGSLTFVKIPADEWILAGITLTAIAGARIGIASQYESNPRDGHRTVSVLQSDGRHSLDCRHRGDHLHGQRDPLSDFHYTPAEVLTLMGVSAGGLVVINSNPNPS